MIHSTFSVYQHLQGVKELDIIRISGVTQLENIGFSLYYFEHTLFFIYSSLSQQCVHLSIILSPDMYLCDRGWKRLFQGFEGVEKADT